MSGFSMWGQLILCLAILVVFHEFGHYIAARAFGIRVEKFFIFFDAWGKKLFSFKKGETEYGVGWLPLGGYVKIAGMIDESMDKEQMRSEPKPWEFRTKPAWQRLIVMVAGVTVNVILAWIILSFYFMAFGETFIPNDNLKHGIIPGALGKEIGLQKGDKIQSVNGVKVERFSRLIDNEVLASSDPVLLVERDGKDLELILPSNLPDLFIDFGKEDIIDYRTPYRVSRVSKKSPAEDAGMQPGDSILSVNGQSVLLFDQLRETLSQNKGKEVQMDILRDGVAMELRPVVDSSGRIGFNIIETIEREQIKYGFFEAIPKGINRSFEILWFQLKAISKMFTGEIDARKSLGGPIAIAHELFGNGFDWAQFWLSTALLSMILAFMNLLPIPALDGGHVIFLIWEMITGKPASEKVLVVAQYIGMIILLTLMVLIFLNDGIRYFGG